MTKERECHCYDWVSYVSQNPTGLRIPDTLMTQQKRQHGLLQTGNPCDECTRIHAETTENKINFVKMLRRFLCERLALFTKKLDKVK